MNEHPSGHEHAQLCDTRGVGVLFSATDGYDLTEKTQGDPFYKCCELTRLYPSSMCSGLNPFLVMVAAPQRATSIVH